MFFNKRLMCRGGRVHETWVCACARDSSVVRVDYTRRPIHDVCVDIKRWVQSRSGNPRRRLSLRAAVTLVAGAATVYCLQLEDLFLDTLELHKRCASSSSGSCSKSRSSGPNMDISSRNRTDQSSPMATPEAMMQRLSSKFWPDISSIRSSSGSTINAEKSPHHRMVDISSTRDTNVFENNIDADEDSVADSSSDNPTNESNIEDGHSKENYDEQLEEEEINKEELVNENFMTKRLKRSSKSKSASSSRSKRYRCTNKCVPDENEGRAETVNVATQTEAVLERDRSQNAQGRETNLFSRLGSYSNQSFDDLPFGITFVYKTRHDRVPSKLIMASLNPKLLSELESTNSQ